MKPLTAVAVANNFQHDLKSLSAYLDNLEKHTLNHTPWNIYPYKPKVEFCIAHANDIIYLKYYVEERSIRAVNSTINSSVWEDTCVEFFIGFDEKGYYNLEFNCIGAALIGYGKNRSDRELLLEAAIKKVKYMAVIQNNVENFVKWDLTLSIPSSVFIHHGFTSVGGKECKANFYKCGDCLPEPHFVAWSDINSEEPNFHLPSFFGTLVFE